MFLFFKDTATTEIYTYCHTLSLHDALTIYAPDRRRSRSGSRPRQPHGENCRLRARSCRRCKAPPSRKTDAVQDQRSEEHTSELQSLMRISYAVFCLKKKHTKHE